MKDLIPFVGDRKSRERVDEVFSRRVLGSIILGKFTGDYLAIQATRLLGVDVGYLFGIAVAFTFFVYWDSIEAKKDDAIDAATDAVDSVTDGDD